MEVAVSNRERPAARRRVDLTYHLFFLILASIVILLSFVLTIVGEREVLLPWLNVALPESCTYQRLFAASCPGCGLTRCFISIAHGNLHAAWGYNPAGLLGFALVASQIPFRAIQIQRIRNGKREIRLGRYGEWPFVAFFVLLFLQWIARTYS